MDRDARLDRVYAEQHAPLRAAVKTSALALLGAGAEPGEVRDCMSDLLAEAMGGLRDALAEPARTDAVVSSGG